MTGFANTLPSLEVRGLGQGLREYSYDSCYRLTASSGGAEDPWSGATLSYGTAYAYSPAGRLTGRSASGTGVAAGMPVSLSLSESYRYNGENPYAPTASGR